MSPEPSHEQLNVYVQDEWKSPLRATTRTYIPGESFPQEIVTSGLPNKPAEFRVPKQFANVEVEVLFEGYSEKKRIAVKERNWVFTIPKSVFDPATNPNRPKTTASSEGVDVEKDKQNVKVGGPINPLSVLQQAIQAVPAVKYALGVAGIAAAIATIKALGLGYGVAFGGAIIMLVLMTALFLFNRLTQSSATFLRGPATVFTWFTLALYMGAAIGLTTSAFFSFPRPLGDLLGGAISGHDKPKPLLAIAGTVINAKNSSGVARALVSTVGGQEIATTDDNGNFYLALHEAVPTVKVHVAANGYGPLEWLMIPPAKDMTFPLVPVEPPPHPRPHGGTGPVAGRAAGSPPAPLPKIPDKQNIGSADQYQREFSEAQGNEDHLIKFSEQAFASLNYEWTVKFLNQAKQVSANKEWQRDYPLLAAATERTTNDHAQFEAILQEMLAEMRLNHSFLHDAARVGEIMQSLSYVRDYVQPESQKYIDNVIMQECLKIKKTL